MLVVVLEVLGWTFTIFFPGLSLFPLDCPKGPVFYTFGKILAVGSLLIKGNLKLSCPILLSVSLLHLGLSCILT